MAIHVKILGVLYIVLSAVGLIGGLALAGAIAAAGLIGAGSGAGAMGISGPLMGLIGASVVGFLIVLSIPGLIAGIGLLMFKPWARMLAIVVSAINLLAFPFGTILGGYGLWVLLSKEGTKLFEPSPQVQSPTS